MARYEVLKIPHPFYLDKPYAAYTDGTCFDRFAERDEAWACLEELKLDYCPDFHQPIFSAAVKDFLPAEQAADGE